MGQATVDHNNICEIREIGRTDKQLDEVIYNHFVIRQQPLIVRNCTGIDIGKWKAKYKWTKTKIVEFVIQVFTLCGQNTVFATVWR